MADYVCINDRFSRNPLQIFKGLEDFLTFCADNNLGKPEVWIRGKGVLTRVPGDQSPFAWEMTLVEVSHH